MLKHAGILFGLLMALALTGTASAQDGPITPQHTDPTWQVAYWNNTSLSGPPVLQRTDTALNFDWGGGSPASGVNADQFSARWLRYIDVSPGTYQLTVTADDGIRVWVDEELLIDQWREQGPTTYTAQKYLGPGHHLVRVEYFENFGGAVVRLSYALASQPPPPPPPTQPITGWRGEYFNNKSLSGPPAVVRDEHRIDYNWGGGSPAPGWIDADGFSVRWSRSVDLPAGDYRFIMTVDDGARLFVNGHLLIDAWKVQTPRTYSGDIYLPGGPVTAQMEYYENTGGAVAQLTWTSASSSPPPPAPPPSTEAWGYVTANRLNVRSGPSLYYPVMGWVYRGEQVRLLGRTYDGTWLRVQAGYNFRGWVSGYYIRSNVPIFNLPVVQ
ncbi:MAG: SH3 domain-containing protein [Anaerolineales bacterium]|nr:SH3 domain-containing protein [Anaerolineales bacterium]